MEYRDKQNKDLFSLSLRFRKGERQQKNRQVNNSSWKINYNEGKEAKSEGLGMCRVGEVCNTEVTVKKPRRGEQENVPLVGRLNSMTYMRC